MVHITKKDLDKDNYYKDSGINTTEEIKIICPKLMDIDVEYDALNVEEKQGKLCNDCGRIMGTNKECWLCNKFNDALNVEGVE